MTIAVAPRRHKPRVIPALSAFAVEHLLLLPAGALLALAWSNVWPESYFRFSYASAFYVNDVAMVFFFALMTKEIVEATIPGGVLHPWQRALAPLFAAVGVVSVPALLYVLLTKAFDEPMLARAWVVPGSIDLALGYFVLRIIFRPRHPVIPFFLLLGIASDGLVLLLVALVYPASDVNQIVLVSLMALALAMALALRRARVRSFWPYIVLSGGASWAALYWGGLHPALALVPVMPFLPHAARDPGFFVDAPPQSHDALNRFELAWRYPAQIALLFFGLVNAGVPLKAIEAGVWAMPLASIGGKPLGLLVGVVVAAAAGLRLPHRIGWRELLVAGLVAAAGFTVGLFVANLAVAPGQLLSETRMGVLLTVAAAPVAVAAARLVHAGRFGA
jgi:Na+:H+ antiporter, NhaA family